MTPKERAAMQQALEALEICVNAPMWDGKKNREAITALREALAEQAKQEPTISDGVCGGCAKKAADGWALYCVECWEKAEQEPVAQVVKSCKAFNVYEAIVDTGNKLLAADTKLYAAPVRTKDLTEFEIMDIYLNGGGKEGGEIGFARAVIAADREKNR